MGCGDCGEIVVPQLGLLEFVGELWRVVASCGELWWVVASCGGAGINGGIISSWLLIYHFFTE